jgi:hypothetical protein
MLVLMLVVVVRIFIEVIRRHSVTCRVWFECVWVGVYFLMQFCAYRIGVYQQHPAHFSLVRSWRRRDIDDWP